MVAFADGSCIFTFRGSDNVYSVFRGRAVYLYVILSFRGTKKHTYCLFLKKLLTHKCLCVKKGKIAYTIGCGFKLRQRRGWK